MTIERGDSRPSHTGDETLLLPYANLQVKHWNPGATKPLILPVHVICNTSDEDLHANIRANSRRPGRWLAQTPEHDGVAVLCGSGPSLADTLDDVHRHAGAGATVFAMNGAARYLSDKGLLADYQVIIDPRPITASLVGPAKAHLFASQVHPSCFEQAPGAQLWHLQIDGIDDLLPDYPHPFALLGGAASVGNTATVLAYAMGFREVHCYGYDSSHRDGAGHAFRQAINDGDPLCKVIWNGREYTTSLTMKLQAERFQETGRALLDAGVRLMVHGSGLLPDMWNTPPDSLPEREKYERMWAVPGYRNMSPGEDAAAAFLASLAPDQNATVIDFGCGTGRGGLALSRAGLNVILVDFAGNCRDAAAMHLPFYQLDLTEPIGLMAEYGYCCDVMEHIPGDMVDTVLANIAASAGTVFFQISSEHDLFGAVINQRLHLTVQPPEWWEARLRAHWASVRRVGQGQFIARREQEC